MVLIVGGSSGQRVSLGNNLTSKQFIQVNSASNWKEFSISMTECPASATQVIATLSGTPDAVPDYHACREATSGTVIGLMELSFDIP